MGSEFPVTAEMRAVMDPRQDIEILVRKVQTGDRAAFEQLLERFRDSLEAWVKIRMGAQLKRSLDVDDVLQDTFLRALQSVDRFEWKDEKAFSNWVCRIAENVIHENVHRVRRLPLIGTAVETPDDAVTQSKAQRRNERFDRLENAIDALDSDYRRVLVLSRLKGVPLKEVARIMDRSPNAISHLVMRAMRKLKELVGDTESLHLPRRTLSMDESVEDESARG